ncbi:MAG: DUF1223 domain-containing protein [Candidatus Omnitrophica bacterium]|nr:DUF1223 domain-containing protein [Candidatus Omnitrophota bacterium]
MNIPGRYAFWVALLSVVFMSFSADELRAVSQQSIAFHSGPNQTALIELYSSEGCSSCPSADEWMNSLKNSPGLWSKFVPVCFHVTYWDDLGWRDSLASPTYTQRQKNYVRLWHSKKSLATPGFVLNGRDWKKWFENPVIPEFEPRTAGILSVEAYGNGAFAASFQPPSGVHSQWLVHAVLLGFGISSEVTAGENAGKKLTHDFAVLDYEQVQLQKIDGAFKAFVNLKLNNKIRPVRYGIAVWVTRDNSLIPVQSAGGYLPD